MLPSGFKEKIQNSLDLSIDFEGDQKEEMIKALAVLIKDLLDNDLEKLIAAIYRIDVSEMDFRQTITTAPPESVHIEVSRLIVERQLQKLKLRREFGSGTH